MFCFQRHSAGCRSVIEVKCMIESTFAGPQTGTAGPFNTTHGSEHLFIRGKSIISSQMRKTGISWCYCYLAGGYKVVLHALDFSYLDSFGWWPPHCVIENPVPCHHTSTVWLPGRASASSSGPALNSLRQALADCSDTENPWLAENNKYPWEAARWTFTVSLAGEGEICQTSH